jgi:hypothetical protein
LNPSNVFSWYSRFRDAWELVEDDERGGRPKSTVIKVNFSAVADLVRNDRRPASRMISESLNIPKTVVLRILKEDFGKRKLCARFVPHSLTPEQREDPSHILPKYYHDGRCRQIFYLTKLLRKMRPGVLPMTSDRVLDRLMRHPLDQRN